MLGQVNRYLLQVAFAFFPPPCPTYLLTDEHPSIEAPCGTLAQTAVVSGGRGCILSVLMPKAAVSA